jgi:hypothetical protein
MSADSATGDSSDDLSNIGPRDGEGGVGGVGEVVAVTDPLLDVEEGNEEEDEDDAAATEGLVKEGESPKKELVFVYEVEIIGKIVENSRHGDLLTYPSSLTPTPEAGLAPPLMSELPASTSLSPTSMATALAPASITLTQTETLTTSDQLCKEEQTTEAFLTRRMVCVPGSRLVPLRKRNRNRRDGGTGDTVGAAGAGGGESAGGYWPFRRFW